MSRRVASLLTLVLGLMALPVAAAAVCPDAVAAGAPVQGEVASDDGIGGSGRGPVGGGEDDGIGGSGFEGPSTGGDDGIGGSGITRGTLTGFGSLCVNGARIALGSAVDVRVDGAASESDALAVGQVVLVRFDIAADGLRTARAVEVQHAVVGTLEARDAARWVVLGQRIEVLPNAAGDLSNLALGQRVAVSGLRRPDGTIAATRIAAVGAHRLDRVEPGDGIEAEALPDGSLLDVEGYVTARVGSSLELGALRFELGEAANSSGLPSIGARVRLQGRWQAATGLRLIRYERVEVERLFGPRGQTPGPGDGAGRPARQVGPVVGAGPVEGRGRVKRPDPVAGRPDRPRARNRPERAERASRPERPDRPARPERPERPERPVRPDRPDRPERPALRDVLRQHR